MRRKLRKRKRKRRVSNVSCDSHHIFFMRVHWNKGLPYELRHHWYGIVEIPKRTVHAKIHSLLWSVPVPSDESILSALEQLRLLEKYGVIRETDNIKKRLIVFIGMFECIEQPTADALKEQLRIVCSFDKPSK